MNFLEDQPVELFEAENGRQAIEQARKHKPDLIVMDIRDAGNGRYRSHQGHKGR